MGPKVTHAPAMRMAVRQVDSDHQACRPQALTLPLLVAAGASPLHEG